MSNLSVASSGGGGGTSTPHTIVITPVLTVAGMVKNRTFYDLTTADGAAPAGLYWVDGGGVITQVSN